MIQPRINLFDAVHSPAMQKAFADIEAMCALTVADTARETTVTVEFTRDNGDRFTITLTGIAPFIAERIVAPWTGAAGWAVLGQPSASSGNRPFAHMTAIEHCGPFAGLRIAFPLLSEAEANRLAAQIASLPAIRKAA